MKKMWLALTAAMVALGYVFRTVSKPINFSGMLTAPPTFDPAPKATSPRVIP